MLLPRHLIESTRNMQVKKKIFDAPEKEFLVTNILSELWRYVILAIILAILYHPRGQSKLLVLSFASYYSCSFCFDFSYPLPSVRLSPDCATLGHPNKTMED